ncbi:MAG: hypothetical protein ACRCVU_13760 [Flavobacterium sp.]
MSNYAFTKDKNKLVVMREVDTVTLFINDNVESANEFPSELVAQAYIHFLCTLYTSQGWKRE